MSNSEDELQSYFDEFINQHGHRPNASQLSIFAGCRYSQASNFLQTVKISSKASKTSRPTSKSVESPQQASVKSIHKSKPRSYSSASAPKKKSKKRPCNNYQLDMTAAEFGACKCGFSRIAHYDRSSWRFSSDDSEENKDILDDYNQNYQPQIVQQEQAETVDNEQYVSARQEIDENEVDKLQNIIKKLRGDIISMQQERKAERNKLLQIINKQKRQVDKLTSENDKLKLNEYQNGQIAYYGQRNEELQQHDDGQKKGPCNNYELDMTGAEFGSCKCGFSKLAHFASDVNAF